MAAAGAAAVASGQAAAVASGESGQEVPARRRCLFCRICDDKGPNKIIYEDETVVVFSDIRPAAKYHFLVVPKEHIRDSKSLQGTQTHIDLLDKLVETGNKVLQERITADRLTENNDASATNTSASTAQNILMGFHWPPFHTISHLHLHVISPSDKMGFIARCIFRSNSLWFVSPEWVKSRLEKLKLDGKF